MYRSGRGGEELADTGLAHLINIFLLPPSARRPDPNRGTERSDSRPVASMCPPRQRTPQPNPFRRNPKVANGAVVAAIIRVRAIGSYGAGEEIVVASIL
jgi:hypothetical protein